MHNLLPFFTLITIYLLLPSYAHTQNIQHEFFTLKDIYYPNTDHTLNDTFEPQSLTLDDNTKKPKSLDYHESFTPPIIPYKRIICNNQLHFDEQFIILPCPSTKYTAIEPQSPLQSRKIYTQHLSLEFNQSEQKILIPSPSPDAHLINLQASPQNNLQLLKDESDNFHLYAISPASYNITITWDVENNDYDKLKLPKLTLNTNNTNLDPKIEKAILLYLKQSKMPKFNSLQEIVDFFRSFESLPLDKDTCPTNFCKILTQKRGLCRHRAFTFTIIATLYAIPTRIISNEAHAFIEIFAFNRWIRIELGGETENFNINSNSTPQDISHMPLQINNPSPPNTNNLNAIQNKQQPEQNNNFDAETALPATIQNHNLHQPTTTLINNKNHLSNLINKKIKITIKRLTPNKPLLRSTNEPIKISITTKLFTIPLPNMTLELYLSSTMNKKYHLTYINTQENGSITTQFTLPQTLPLGKWKLHADIINE